MDNNQANPNEHGKPLSHPRPSRLPWLLRCGLAVGAVAAAMGLRLALTAWVGPGLPLYVTFYPAVMVAALLGGVGPGLVATGLAGLVVGYWVIPPFGQFSIHSPVDRLGLVIFAGMGALMSVVAELYRRNRHKAAAYDREAAVRESQAQLATFAAATFEGIVESEGGRILDCNEQYARMFGYSVAELRGTEIASLAVPEDRDRVRAVIAQGRESAIEHTGLRKDGTRIVIEAHGRPVSPGSARRHSAVRDITERKRAEEETQKLLATVQQEQVRLSSLIGSISDEVWFADTNRKFTLANPSAAREFCLSSADATGVESLVRSLEVYRGDGTPRPVDEAPPLRALAGEVIRGEEEIVRTPGGGELRHRQVSAAPVRDAAGTIIGSVSVVRDITERKRAQEALRESEERYRTLFNTIDAGFCIIEMIFDAAGKPADYRFLEVNPAFERQTGLRAAQGKLMRELAPAHEAHWFEIYGKIALTGEPARFVHEARALNRWYDVYAYRVGVPASRQVAILFNDISAHKQAEAELRRQAEELRAANEELARFNRITLGRELRVIELKKQVNELCARLGQPPRYAPESR